MDSVQLAAVLAAVVVVASMISVEVGLSVALIELGLGVVVGNAFSLDPNADWLVFIATFASIVLTFLAGAEVDPDDFRQRFGASVGIGLVSFIGPFVVAGLVAYGLLGWTVKASLIAGTALSTTSLAVVYAVLVETGLNVTRIGKLIMSACFVTDMATAIALSAIFIRPNAWFPAFLVVSIALIVGLPKVAPWFFGRYGDRVIEPEIKLVFASLLVLMVLADAAKGHAVLPAFILGLVMAKHYQQHRTEQERLRVVAFAFLTPFFFLRGGLNVSLGAVFANLGLLGGLVRRQDDSQALLGLAPGPSPRSRACDLHHPADEHRAHLRDDLFALRVAGGDHRQDAVLPPGHGGGPVGDRSHCDRPALVLTPGGGRVGRRPRTRAHR